MKISWAEKGNSNKITVCRWLLDSVKGESNCFTMQRPACGSDKCLKNESTARGQWQGYSTLPCAYKSARHIFTADQCIFKPRVRAGSTAYGFPFQKRAKLRDLLLKFGNLKISEVCFETEAYYYSYKQMWWVSERTQFSIMDNVMKKWNGSICALSSYNQVQGADSGQCKWRGSRACSDWAWSQRPQRAPGPQILSTQLSYSVSIKWKILF